MVSSLVSVPSGLWGLLNMAASTRIRIYRFTLEVHLLLEVSHVKPEAPVVLNEGIAEHL